MSKLNLIPLSNKPVSNHDIEFVSETGNYIEAKRKDGLIVFFDKHDDEFNLNRLLNEIRLSASPDQVVKYTGIIRGFQISLNYSKKNLPKYRFFLINQIKSVVKSLNFKGSDEKTKKNYYESKQDQEKKTIALTVQIQRILNMSEKKI